MDFYVMTLFPEMIEQTVAHSITGRAIAKGLINVNAVNIRDYTTEKHGKTDDYPYGGGAGMVMQVQPVHDCYKAVCAMIKAKHDTDGSLVDKDVRDTDTDTHADMYVNTYADMYVNNVAGTDCCTDIENGSTDTDIGDDRDVCLTPMPACSQTPHGIKVTDCYALARSRNTLPCNEQSEHAESFGSDAYHKPRVLYMSPQGRTFNQSFAKELAREEELVFLCGHYEGIDERALELLNVEEVSIGDFILTGGELPAAMMIDCISRLIPGVLGGADSAEIESFHDNLLEYPQYSRPEDYLGMKVPEVLLSGHHANVEKWRREQSIIRTLNKRPDLIDGAVLNKKEQKFLHELLCTREENNKSGM